MYWYRIYLSLGRASIVGTTIKDPEKLPQHLVADEKHTWISGKRVYLPTTVAKGCPSYRKLWKTLKGKLWRAYKAHSASEFLKGLRQTLVWTKKHIRKKRTLNKMRKLCRRNDLNGFQYHDNWLHNLLIASSMNGRRPAEKLPTHKIR